MLLTGHGSRVPLDVVDCIIEEIANADDITSLRSCALVCRDFTDLCQKRIFADVILTNGRKKYADPSQALITRFEKLLEHKPRIAQFVRTLRYEYDAHHHPAHSVILGTLRSVKAFYFRITLSPPSWNGTNASFKDSFFKFLQSNDIIDLYITRADDIPLQIFLYLPKLIELMLDSVTFEAGTECPSPVNALKLRSFVADRSGGLIVKDLLMRHSEQLFDFSHLEEFEVNFDDNRPDAKTVAIVMQQSCRLRSLIVRCDSYSLDFRNKLATALTASSLRTLRKIEIYISVNKVDDDPYCHLPHELDKLAARNVLEEIKISTFVALDGTCTTELSRWSHLDKVLSQQGAFPALRRVELEVCIGHGLVFPERLHQDIIFISVNGFPKLSATEQVEFSMTVDTQLI